MKIGQLLHLILPIDERDELERFLFVFRSARDDQHIAIAIGDILQLRISTMEMAAAAQWPSIDGF